MRFLSSAHSGNTHIIYWTRFLLLTNLWVSSSICSLDFFVSADWVRHQIWQIDHIALLKLDKFKSTLWIGMHFEIDLTLSTAYFYNAMVYITKLYKFEHDLTLFVSFASLWNRVLFFKVKTWKICSFQEMLVFVFSSPSPTFTM